MKTIVIVDDEFDLLDTLRIILEGDGYEVQTCTSGETALECLARIDPDLVLLDVMLPGMNGLDVLERIRTDARHERIKVILMSAVRLPGAEGHDAFLRKPFSMEALESTVGQLIGPAQ